MQKFCVIFLFLTVNSLFSQVMQSSSKIDWTKSSFDSTILFDAKKAHIIMPSGRGTIVDKIHVQLPSLIKNQLLYTKVSSSMRLGDLITAETLALEQISGIIDGGRKTPSFFSPENDQVQVSHGINIKDISSIMIAHTSPYQLKAPIEKVASRKYTGIIIDVRGSLKVQGEFIATDAKPCLFPRVWDETMNLLYERNMVDPAIAKKQGIVQYGYSDNLSEYAERVGNDPLRIIARKIYGIYPTDPVISRTDALKILSIPENLALLKQGKVVLLMDKENLIYDISVPNKTEEYYTVYTDLSNYFYEKREDKVTVSDSYKGIQLDIREIKFSAESDIILPEEFARLNSIAENIKKALQVSDFTILVEGHTARIGNIETELPLSLARARSIVAEMVLRGLPEEIFSYKGYGGEVPIASNETPEGRAQNRRVEIIIQPKMTKNIEL